MDTSLNQSKKDKTIKLLVSPTLKAELQQLADQRNITLSSLIRLLASDYIRKHK